MSRNPFATNLRHHKPKRIEDKRERLLEAALQADARIGTDISDLSHEARVRLARGG